MASLTSRLAGWAAGRLKGEKARKKTMEFVDKTGVGKALSLVGDAALLGGAGKLAGMGARAVGAKLGIGGVPATADPMAGLAKARDAYAKAPGMPISDAARNDALKMALEKAQTDKILPNIAGAMERMPAGMEQFGGQIAQRGGFRGISDMVQRGAADYIGQPRTMAERLAGAAGRVGGAVRGVGSYLAQKPEVAGQALTAYTTARQGAANRQLQREQLAQRESEFEREYGLRRGQDEREIERQRRIAEMLAPLFQRIAGGQG